MITVMRCDLYTIGTAPGDHRPRWYHILMKLFCLFALAALSLPAADGSRLKQVNTVYILGMTGGMDQYLANRLTSLGVFQVVTDPQKADAILTDRLGEPFESKLKELYPPPPAPPPKDADADAGKNGKKDKKDTMDFGGGTARVLSSSSRGKGNFFLVDPKSKAVLWSVYDPPKDSTPGELSRTATRVVRRLKSDLTEKRQPDE
jgi:hypothetical protein